MPNENCLKGVKCPKCGQDEKFGIAMDIVHEVTDDGVGDHIGEMDWADDSYCECRECWFSGKFKDFREKGADGEMEYTRVEDKSIDDAWGVFKDGELIAVVDTETMAARLCAAEDMLEALKSALAWLNGYEDGVLIGEGLRMKLAVKAAIEKATVSERT